MTEKIVRLLAQRYTLPEWVLVPQVRDGTGFTASRTADAVAMNCYPSKGLEVHGFEFKVARSDWLRELRDGAKAEVVAQHCDRWWIVATEDVVVRAELPTTWGLILCKDDAIRTVVAAPALRDAPATMDRCFVASFLRGCLERAKKPTDEALRDSYEAGRKYERKSTVEAEERAEKVAEAAERRADAAIRAFEEKSGIRIDNYDGERLGEEFMAFRDLRGHKNWRPLTNQAAELREMADKLDALSKAFVEAPGGRAGG